MKPVRAILFFLLLSLLFFGLGYLISCSSNSGGGDDDAVDDDASDDDWQPVEPHREDRGNFIIAWLAGTPYEMGIQQGQLLHEELRAAVDWLDSMHLIELLTFIAKTTGIYDLAYNNSYPDIVEECRGIVDASSDVGMTMDICILLNFGDVLVEFLSDGMPPAKLTQPACSQAVAAYDATKDGRLYHARSLDWSQIDYLIKYPVIFVRQPVDGIPHAYIGFPCNLSPYNGMNASGLSIASDEADPIDSSEDSRTGHSHVQMIAQILKTAHNLQEARQFIESESHMSTEIFMVADGPNRKAAVFEMTAKHLGVRELAGNGVVYATNHFVAPETKDFDKDPASDSTLLRFDRLRQLLEPDGIDTYYGQIDPSVMVKLLRDRINPWTGQESPPDEFDNDQSIATNGAIYQIVFDPEKLLFWVAAGAIPVPQQPFVCFSLGELLQLPNAQKCEPEVFE